MIHHHSYNDYGPAEVRFISDVEINITWHIGHYPALSISMNSIEAEELGGDLLESANASNLERSEIIRKYDQWRDMHLGGPAMGEAGKSAAILLLHQAMNLLGADPQ